MKYLRAVLHSYLHLCLHLAIWSIFLLMVYFHNKIAYGDGWRVMLAVPLVVPFFYAVYFIIKGVLRRRTRARTLLLTVVLLIAILPLCYCYLYLFLPLFGRQVHQDHVPFSWTEMAVVVYGSCLKFGACAAVPIVISRKLRTRELLRILNRRIRELRFAQSGTRLSAHTQFDLLTRLIGKFCFDPELFRKYLFWVVEVNRYMAENVYNMLVPLSEELAHARRMATMIVPEAVSGSPEWMVVRGSVSDIRVPPMSIVSIVENMGKHGDLRIADSFGLEIICLADSLEVVSWNQVASIRSEKSLGLGSEILRQRLSLVFGKGFLFRKIKEGGIYRLGITIYYDKKQKEQQKQHK